VIYPAGKSIVTSRFFVARWEIVGDEPLEILHMSEPETKPSRAFLPYPVSTLSPPIIPNDLTSFKSRGISQVERDLQQKLQEIRETYLATIDHFNWNKLVYEADIQFEPIIGGTYHLYEMRGRRLLSMISPDQWSQKHLATVRLNMDRQWKIVETGTGVDSRVLFGTTDL
jgi:Protein of unknown function (DUF2452)